MNKIIIVRHGEVNTNVKNVLPKFGDPDHLTENGIKQMEATGKKLREMGLNVLYASKEYRALQSAKIIGNICEVKVSELGGIEERNWGDFTGKPWSEVKVVLDPLTLEERYNYIPPKGESWKNFEKRLISSIKYINSINQDKTIGVVAHGGSIRALIPFLLNTSKEKSFKYDPKNASISIFDFAGEKIMPITIDDTEHLINTKV